MAQIRACFHDEVPWPLCFKRKHPHAPGGACPYSECVCSWSQSIGNSSRYHRIIHAANPLNRHCGQPIAVWLELHTTSLEPDEAHREESPHRHREGRKARGDPCSALAKADHFATTQ